MPRQPAVTLTDDERTTLECIRDRSTANASTLMRARFLLKSGDVWSTATLAAFDVCEATVINVRRQFAQGRLDAVLHDKVQQHWRSVFSDVHMAHLSAVAYRPATESHEHLMVRLLV